MIDWLAALCLAADKAKEQPGSPLGPLLFPMVVIGFLWYFLLFRPQRREQQRRQDVLKALKKNDRVVTIGGIIGTIASMSQDGQDVTIKVDDNTRIRMLRSSIQGPYKEKEEGDASK
jgi:preprotein translocase subunit YajC